MIDQNRIFSLDPQTVVIEDFPAEGFILDIGGGGEGTIGQLKGAQVIAIDSSHRELEEAPAGPLKTVMDARDLKFLNSTFNTVTGFFAFMFIPPGDHGQVFQEIYRVLASNGLFFFWDVEIQQRPNPQQDMLVFPLQVKLPTKVINTGYGTPYTEKSITLDDYVDLAERAGFITLEQRRSGQTFFCEFRKP